MAELAALARDLEGLRGAHQGLDRRLAVEVFGFRPSNSSAWPWLSPYGKFYRTEVPPYTANLGTISVAIRQRWPGYRINASWSADHAGVELFVSPPFVVEAQAPNLTLALCLAAARLAAAEAGAAHA